MPQKFYHFYLSKTDSSRYLVKVSKNILIEIYIFCISSSVGNWYNYSEVVICLHFDTFTTHNCMFSATFSIKQVCI
jgi:hypothetical protein